MPNSGRLFAWIVLIAALLSGTARPIAAQNRVRAIPVDLLRFPSTFAPDGKTLAIAAEPNIYDDKVQPNLLPIRLFDLTSGKETVQWQGVQTDFATGLIFAPDGNRLISTHFNGQLNVWDVNQGKAVKSYQLPAFGLRFPKFLADGKRLSLLASGVPAHILIVDTESGAITAYYGPVIKTFDGFQQNMTGFPQQGDFSYTTYDLSPDGKTLAAATLNDEIDVWDVSTGQMTVAVQPVEKKMLLNVRPLVFTPDGKSIMYYHHDDNKLHFLDVATHKDNPQSVSGGANFALSAKGDKLAWLDKSQVYTLDFKAA